MYSSLKYKQSKKSKKSKKGNLVGIGLLCLFKS